MSDTFTVEVHDDNDSIGIDVEIRDDGFYIDWGEGFRKYESNTSLRERDVRQLINKEFNKDYGGSIENLEDYE